MEIIVVKNRNGQTGFDAVTASEILWLLIAAESKKEALQKARELGVPPGKIACCSLNYVVKRNGRVLIVQEMNAEGSPFPALIGVVDVRRYE